MHKPTRIGASLHRQQGNNIQSMVKAVLSSKAQSLCVPLVQKSTGPWLVVEFFMHYAP
jgi:hypothetical protein